MTTDPKSTVIRYVRHPWTGALIGCVVAINTTDGIKYGWSQCNKLDTFNKKVGRNIAIQRALFPPSEPLVPAKTAMILFEPLTGTPRSTGKVDLITPNLKDIQDFAENVAFAPKPQRPNNDQLPPGVVFNADKTQLIEEATGHVIAHIRLTDHEDELPPIGKELTDSCDCT